MNNEYKATCLLFVISHSFIGMSGCSKKYVLFYHKKIFTELNIACSVECRIVYNDGQKMTKIESGWRDFSKAQSFTPNMEIVFEFPDPNVN